MATDLVVADLVALRGVRVVDLRVGAVAFVARFTVCLDVAALLLLTGVGLFDDVRRLVVGALDLTGDDFDGVDFFRVDDVFDDLDVVVFRFVVVAFLVAILPLPTK